MGYLQDCWLMPLVRTAKRIKILLISGMVDVLFLLFCYYIAKLSLLAVLHFAEPMGAHNLQDIAVLTANVDTYSSQLGIFYASVFVSAFFIIVTYFIAFTISRTFIWNRILGVRGNYLRNSLIDGTVYLIAILVFLFITFFVKYQYQTISFAVIGAILMYYSFLCHMNLGKHSAREIFKAPFSFQAILLLPHAFVFGIIFYVLRHNQYSLAASILILIIAFVFRIYAHEAVKAFANVLKEDNSCKV